MVWTGSHSTLPLGIGTVKLFPDVCVCAGLLPLITALQCGLTPVYSTGQYFFACISLLVGSKSDHPPLPSAFWHTWNTSETPHRGQQGFCDQAAPTSPIPTRQPLPPRPAGTTVPPPWAHPAPLPPSSGPSAGMLSLRSELHTAHFLLPSGVSQMSPAQQAFPDRQLKWLPLHLCPPSAFLFFVALITTWNNHLIVFVEYLTQVMSVWTPWGQTLCLSWSSPYPQLLK